MIVPGGFADHGIGGAKDLPLPPELAIVGAVAALAVSFAVLALAWREPRYDGRRDGPVRGRPAPAWLSSLTGSPGWHVAMRAIGLLFFGFGAFAAVFGQDLLTNPIFGMFYVWWWVGLPVASLLLGPVWRAVSPVRTVNAFVAKISGGDPERGAFTYSPRIGYWPAALGLLAFVWIELVYAHGTELGPVRLWCAVYVAVMLIGGTLFGNTFYENADPFEVYSSLMAKLSIWARAGHASGDGTLVVRSPLANLSTLEARPGLVAVVATLFGSTAFDSFRDSSPWVKFVQSTDVSSFLLNNVALVAFCVVVGLVFVAGTMATGVDAVTRRTTLPDQLAHSIVPIVAGYIVAHYLTYLVEVGQQTLIQASDPLSNGSNWFGTAGMSVNYAISYHPTALATTKVLAVVLGHVVGVVAAHDRALALLPPRHKVTGQLPLLLAMVAFTIGGLYLLFAA
ncbi:MAG: hypothetical protein ABIO16_14885 [Nocardioides sp.]